MENSILGYLQSIIWVLLSLRAEKYFWLNKWDDPTWLGSDWVSPASRDPSSANYSDILSGQSESLGECQIFEPESWELVQVLDIIDIIYKYLSLSLSPSLCQDNLPIPCDDWDVFNIHQNNNNVEEWSLEVEIVPDGWLYSLLYILIQPRQLSEQIWPVSSVAGSQCILGQETAGESSDRQHCQQDSSQQSVWDSWGAEGPGKI